MNINTLRKKMSGKKAVHYSPRKESKLVRPKTFKPVSSEPKTRCPYTFELPARHPYVETTVISREKK